MKSTDQQINPPYSPLSGNVLNGCANDMLTQPRTPPESPPWPRLAEINDSDRAKPAIRIEEHSPPTEIVFRLCTKVGIVLLVVWQIAALFAQSHVGLADNGDYTRIMSIVTSGPVGFEHNWPDNVTQASEYDRRFFQSWVPYWKLDFPRESQPFNSSYNTSATLLWYPGVLMNYLFYSADTLHLSFLSLFPRLILIGVLLLLFRRICAHAMASPLEKALFCGMIGLCFVLWTTTTDYAAYLNSFYFETASWIFLLVFVLCLTAPVRDDSRWRSIGYYACMATLLLLAAAKASNFYWPLVAVPFVLVRFGGKLHSGRFFLKWAVWSVALTSVAYFFTSPPDPGYRINAYHRLFYGVLTFSENPSQRLAEVGLADCAMHVGQANAESSDLTDIAKSHRSALSFSTTLRIIAREPTILWRMAVYAAANMQTASPSYLGQRSANDPSTKSGALANLWSEMKLAFFPRGYALYATLFAYIVLFAAAVRSAAPRRELATVGLLASIACLVDMNVAILGDGRYELVKHLFLANLLFDLATITAANVVVIYLVGLARKKRSAVSLGGWRVVGGAVALPTIKLLKTDN